MLLLLLPPDGATPHTTQLVTILVIKLLVLPWLMCGCAKLVGLDGNSGMSVVLTTVLPGATIAYVVGAVGMGWQLG